MAVSIFSTSMGRFAYLPLLFLTFALSATVLGLSGSLTATYGSHFPNGDLASRTRLLAFAGAWNTLFGLVFGFGVMAPKWFGTGKAFTAFFIGFLLFLVGASSITQTILVHLHDQHAAFGSHWSLVRAEEGVAWAACWINFFLVLVVAKMHLSKEPEVQEKGKESATA